MMEMKKNVTAVLLAAGQGNRMKSGYPKVLHEILGRPSMDILAVIGYQCM